VHNYLPTMHSATPLILVSVTTVALASHAQSFPVNTHYRIDQINQVDSTVVRLLQPYTDSLYKTLNRVIGFSVNGMSKRPGESTLGNFMADCMKAMAERKFNIPVDAAFVNYGGIRSYIPRGEITIKKVYELMPFDNLVVLQQMKGDSLRAFLNKTAETGGWPSSGIKMAIEQRHAKDIVVNGKPLTDTGTYTIANTDYIANGGEDCTMLKNIPQINMGYLYREAIIQYITEFTTLGKPVDAKTENRITHVN